MSPGVWLRGWSPVAWVLGCGCEARTLWHGCWGSYGMDAEICQIK